ncbi:MAG: FAD-dependent oxidoreductase [Ancalomicrobiaceae bacterium]|nr:FAD-dependent oxidoreductase [Ancalomicrobiaceae bacterium]
MSTEASTPSPQAFSRPAFFDNYTKRRHLLPGWFWSAGRIVAFGYGLFLIGMLVFDGPVGLKLFWGITIPSLPILLVVAPGVWRQVCPMAFLNQIPRQYGFSQSRDLPELWRNAAFGIAVAFFVGAVSLRVPLFNHIGWALAAGLVFTLGLAFAGGLVFKGRSGWCGTFCPLGPVQRTYGQAPLLVVSNGYCATCVGCQKACYDFNPRAAVFTDVYDDDPRYAGQRRLFMGLLPGLIGGYFLQGPAPDYSMVAYVGIIIAACFASAGLFWAAVSFLPVRPYHLAAAFGAIALALFYWFSGPTIVRTVADLAGSVPSDAAVGAARGIGIVAALILVASGLRSEWHYRQSLRDAAARSDGSRSALKSRAAAGHGAEVTDRETGITFNVAADASLLDAVQAAGLKINYGCRAGVCGADAVAICDGGEHLSPASDDDLATLRRLGLEGRARLACVCQVKGPVVIDRDPNSAPAAKPSAPAEAKQDRGLVAGISRVVIVGNGVSGMGVAEALRRDSPSMAIEIVTNETLHFYNRMAIGRLIYGTSGLDGMQLVPDNWFSQNRVEVHRNTIAAAIDRDRKRLILATGQALAYDKLVLATGARAATPEPEFLERSNAFVLRTADDALAIRDFVQARGCRRAVVIGGGVLGVEAADALRHLGLKVTLLQRSDRLMNAQLDEGGAQKLTAYLEGLGIQVVTNASIKRFDGEAAIASAWLSHGPRVRADLYVACLGVQANSYLAETAGLDVGRGIRVNGAMRTSDPHIYAVGDVAELKGPSGLWPIGAAQAQAAAADIFGDLKPFEMPRIVLQLKCDGIDLRSYGDPAPMSGDEVFSSHPDDLAYWRIIQREGQLSGAVYVGPPGSAKHFTRVVHKGFDLAPLRDDLRRGILDGMKALQ